MKHLVLFIFIAIFMFSDCTVDPDANNVNLDDETVSILDGSDDPTTYPTDDPPATNPPSGSRSALLNINISGSTDPETESATLYINKIEIENVTTEVWETVFIGSEKLVITNLDTKNIVLFPGQYFDPGEYGQIRIYIDDRNEITVNSETMKLHINSGIIEKGLKLAGGFNLIEGCITIITIECDLNRYTFKNKHKYRVKPVVKITSTKLEEY